MNICSDMIPQKIIIANNQHKLLKWNTEISPNFLMWELCLSTKFPHQETESKFRYFMQCDHLTAAWLRPVHIGAYLFVANQSKNLTILNAFNVYTSPNNYWLINQPQNCGTYTTLLDYPRSFEKIYGNICWKKKKAWRLQIWTTNLETTIIILSVYLHKDTFLLKIW